MNSCHIACFTPPLPDESCYSVLCRCLVRESVSSFRFELQMFNRQRDLSRLLYQPFRFEDLSRWFDDAESRQREYLDLHSVLQYRYPVLAESARRLIRYWRDCHCLAVGVDDLSTVCCAQVRNRRIFCHDPSRCSVNGHIQIVRTF